MPLFKPETFGATTFYILWVPRRKYDTSGIGLYIENPTATVSGSYGGQGTAATGFYTDKKPESSPTFISGIDTNSGSVTEQEKCWGTIGFPDKGKQQREYNESNSESEGEAEARELGLEFRRSYARYLRFKRDLAENIINLDEWLLCNGEQKEEEIMSVACLFIFPRMKEPLSLLPMITVQSSAWTSPKSSNRLQPSASSIINDYKLVLLFFREHRVTAEPSFGSASSCPISMDNIIADVESLYRLRYLSGVALAAIVYDHLLTLNDELLTIWANPNRDFLQKLMFLINRYYTEAMVMYVVYVTSGLATLDDAACRRFIWVFALTAIVFIAITHFFITLRIYHSWDKRKRMAVILLVAFTTFIPAAAVLAIISAVHVQSVVYCELLLRTCRIPDIPSTFPYMMGTLLGFDLFIIILALFNAFERPHRTHADVIDALHRDGARLFFQCPQIEIVMRLVCLIMSIVGLPADCFGVLNVMWTLTAIISSRIHLRVEELKSSTIGWGSSLVVI
ncbi:hypothetical protein J3R30DRAFT_3403115 [Lentinula aciculospora]|uniref:DUF6533 domain-containing protein n=1 Tax=Lentinula aciculospora TaxID=153920 RepID=A0A9W9AH12_9AGAR|nr:hypothetical protein J3R30DRAFT_3403115 [Lentinula aciculospora]